MSAAVLTAVLVAGGVYLVLQRGLVRVTFGFVLLGHAALVVLLAAGGMDRREPPLLAGGGAELAADPLPQAFALTAIVIAFGITVYLLAMAGSGGELDGAASDADEDEIDAASVGEADDGSSAATQTASTAAGDEATTTPGEYPR